MVFMLVPCPKEVPAATPPTVCGNNSPPLCHPTSPTLKVGTPVTTERETDIPVEPIIDSVSPPEMVVVPFDKLPMVPIGPWNP